MKLNKLDCFRSIYLLILANQLISIHLLLEIRKIDFIILTKTRYFSMFLLHFSLKVENTLLMQLLEKEG